MEDHITYYILYIQDETTQHKPTQQERVFGTKSPNAKTWSAQNHPDSVHSKPGSANAYYYQFSAEH